tara:strand:- start:386 stop:1549 length:1164 start_codon:yes stop_codon:yes gene_type:complete
MEKQKICIIGASLTGLVTAISLSKLNCDIDLVADNFEKNLKTNRTIAISNDNLNFLTKLDISKNLRKEVWPCSGMELYASNMKEEFSKIFEINKENSGKQVFYMTKNSHLIKLMVNKIKSIKSICIKKNKKVNSISNSGLFKSIKFDNHYSKYNLIIICAGNTSSLVNNIFGNQIIENSYKEFGITTIINHDLQNNNTARQVFLNDEILAFLPISKNKTSIVWTAKKDINKKSDLFVKKKIEFYSKNYLQNIKLLSQIERQDLSFSLRKKYFQDRVLLFGDALHKVHPLTGQGFNMILRDLSSLEKILKDKINLGLDIGGAEILSEFSNEVKPRNFLYSVGIDIIRNCFNSKNNSYKNIRNEIIKKLNKNHLAKNIFYDIADRGIRF